MDFAAQHEVGEELDRLCELASIGAGHAANALASLVGRTIRMSVPRVRMGAATPQTDARDDAWLFFEVEGALGGALVFRMPGGSREALVRELIGVGAESIGVQAESALREVGNILASHALSAIADLVGTRVLPSLPSLVFEASGPALHAWRARAAGRICIETHLVDDCGHAAVELVWIPAEIPGAAPSAPF